MLVFFIVYFELILLICFKLAACEKTISSSAYRFNLDTGYLPNLYYFKTCFKALQSHGKPTALQARGVGKIPGASAACRRPRSSRRGPSRPIRVLRAARGYATSRDARCRRSGLPPRPRGQPASKRRRGPAAHARAPPAAAPPRAPRPPATGALRAHPRP